MLMPNASFATRGRSQGQSEAGFLDAEVLEAAHAVGAAIGLADHGPVHPGVKSHLIAARTQLEAVTRLLDAA
jgi:hypothetical protein